MVARLIQPDRVTIPAGLPAVESSRKQADGWSFGFWCLLWSEQAYRQHREECCRLLEPDWPRKRQYLNFEELGGIGHWLVVLQSLHH